jgi:hypothetical protein
VIFFNLNASFFISVKKSDLFNSLSQIKNTFLPYTNDEKMIFVSISSVVHPLFYAKAALLLVAMQLLGNR